MKRIARKKKRTKETPEENYFLRYLDKVMNGTSTIKDATAFNLEDTKTINNIFKNEN